MAKINLQAVEVLQMDGSYQTVDMREEACKPLWLHHDEDKVQLALRLYQGECEVSPDEEKILRELIEPWSWVARSAIEKQLTAK
jgi:hypothetical protein